MPHQSSRESDGGGRNGPSGDDGSPTSSGLPNEDRYDLATRSAKVGVWDWNVKSGEFYLDPNVKVLLGYGDSEVPNDLATWSEYIHPEDRDLVSKAIEDHLEGRSPEFTCEHRMLHKDGRVRWILARGRALRDETGDVVRMVGTDFDITERKQAETALRESEERHRAVVEQSRDCIFLVDLKSRIVEDANTAFLELLRYTLSDLGKITLYDFIAHPREDIDDRIQRIVARKLRYLGIRKYRRKDGSLVDVEVSVDPIFYGGRTVMCVVSRDLTEQKRHEREREELQARVRDAQKLESLMLLAGGVAHDFNNVLLSVLGNADLALDAAPADSSLHTQLESIRESASRAADLSRQLLAYSGHAQYAAEPVDPNALIKETEPLLRASVSKGARLRPHLEDGLPAISVDAKQFRQAVLNLVANASESLGDNIGEISISTRRARLTPADLERMNGGGKLRPGDYVCVEVADTGSGMAPETLSRIFDPYYSTKATGRGLGLAVVQGIITAHGGAVQASSSPGEGSILAMWLPVSDEAAAPKPAKALGVRPGALDATILLVDDEEQVRQVVSSMLAHHGCHVLTSADGPSAVEIFRTSHDVIDMVLLDVTMPGLDGFRTFRLLRDINPRVPVLFSSGYAEESLEDRLDGIDAVAFIEKPYLRLDLVASIRDLLVHTRDRD